jgi:hypothetical protein
MAGQGKCLCIVLSSLLCEVTDTDTPPPSHVTRVACTLMGLLLCRTVHVPAGGPFFIGPQCSYESSYATTLTCYTPGHVVSSVYPASYGREAGYPQNYTSCRDTVSTTTSGACWAPDVAESIAKQCIGQAVCNVGLAGLGDPCPGASVVLEVTFYCAPVGECMGDDAGQVRCGMASDVHRRPHNMTTSDMSSEVTC